MNSQLKGDIAHIKAIEYFTLNGYTVLLPITDHHSFDLVVMKNNACQTVQVKYTSDYTPSTCRFRASAHDHTHKSSSLEEHYKDIDLFFIVVPTGFGIIDGDYVKYHKDKVSGYLDMLHPLSYLPHPTKEVT
jgi:hypothetical protein